MMFRGAKNFPPAKYEAVLKAAGTSSSAYTTEDHTAYHTTFPKYEALRDTAFDCHTYKHSIMGCLKDIQDMPN